MYAGTKFNWYDQSGINQTVEAEEIVNRPLFMTGITADKGTEELVRLHGDDFYKMYGRNLSFTKHGQPLLQAGRIIDQGAELLVKRVVAEDSTLSNIVIVANVSDTEVQREDANGNLIYTDPNTGEETTESQVQKVDANGNLVYTDAAGAEVTEASTQKVDADGNLVYVDAAGVETTEVTSQKVDANGKLVYVDAEGAEVTEVQSQKKDADGNLVYTDNTGSETTETQSQKLNDEGNPVYMDAEGVETTEATSQKKDAEGNLLFIDPNTGDETTSADDGAGTTYLPSTVDNTAVMVDNEAVMVDNTAVMVDNTAVMVDNVAVMVDCEAVMDDTGCNVKWEVQTVSNCKTYDEVMESAQELFDDAAGVYPMIVVTDIGRNADCKAIRIAPDYDISRSLGFMFYRVFEFENTTSEENINITMNPSIKYRNVSYAINKYSMGQLQLGTVDGVFDAYVAKLAEAAGVSVDEMKMLDIINGTNCKGVALHGIVIDPDSVDLSYDYGISLQSGSNGTQLGDAPFSSENYGTAVAKLFNGEYTDEVYDVDIHKICAICDANYPKVVKDAIKNFVDFREDCSYFRDLGLGLETFDLIYAEAQKYKGSRFCSNYMTSYKVTDPYTNKRIDVTMMYDFAPTLVNHFVNGMASNPLAGEINGFTMDSAIRGTVNYVPRKTPATDQKGLLDDARINYATYYEYEGNLVVDSLYTAQDEYTQLSYINNVLAIQEVMRAVRTICPKNRFKFTSANDFSDYAEAVNEVLEYYKNNFETLNFVYLEDPTKEAQKIYYAAIEFTFNNWAQSEIFDLYALNATEIVEE